MAVAIVMMMIAGGLAVLPAMMGSHTKTPAELPAKASAVGARTVTYTIDHWGESYLKNADLVNNQGNRTLTEGLNDWWTTRLTGYGEYIIHNSYPFVTSYGLESSFTTAPIDPGFGLTTMVRMSIVANNLRTMGTAKGMDPIFIPVLNPASPGGGNVTIQWRSDVASAPEMAAMKASSSTYFGRTYYAAPRIASANDDGYWNLIYGHLTFDAAASKTYLNLAANTGDLRTEFTAANVGNAIGNLWLGDWLTESGSGGIYDTTAGYEYPNDIRQIVLTLDPASTATKLDLRFWTIGWGNDVYLMRMFDASGLNKYLESYFENMYFNATIGVSWANITTSYYMQYAAEAWANPATGGASWSLQAQHIDYVATAAVAPAWVSNFNGYDPKLHPDMTLTSYLPGTVHYGQQVDYYVTPKYWPLISGETLNFKLPTRAFYGYNPYVGASDKVDATKVTEIQGHGFSGDTVLGSTNPNMLANYNAGTKTVTFVGPTSYARDPSPVNPLLNASGVPEFNIDVLPFQNYNLNLAAGWNLISLPLQTSYKASTLPGLVNGDTVTAWNEATQTYKTFIKGVTPPIADFALVPSNGYWVWVPSAKTCAITGVKPVSVQSRTITLPSAGVGWFMVGFLSGTSVVKHASDVAAMYAPAGKISVVAMFDPAKKTYTTYIVGIPMNNFALTPGLGFWCYVSSSGTLTYTPW